MKVGVLKTYDPTKAIEVGNDSPYIVAETLDLEKYNDITSIENLIKFCVDFDYKKVTVILKDYVSTIGFENLSNDEKILACKRFLVPKEIVIQYLTEDEIKDAWSIQNIETRKARESRWNAIFNLLSFSLPKQYAFDLAFSVDSLGLSNNYLIYGLEAEAIDGIPGLWDYFEGTSTFTGGGFPAKEYWSQDLQDKIMLILRDGIY